MNLLERIFGREQWTWESHLQTRLGISRDELRELRGRLLTEGPDWRTEKNRVEVSRAGIEKLVTHLRVASAAESHRAAELTAPEGGDGAEKKSAAPGAAEAGGPAPVFPPAAPVMGEAAAGPAGDPASGGVVELHVWRADLPNTRIVEAFRPGSDPLVRANILRVRVKDARKFSRFDHTGKRMVIRATHLQADLYEVHGPAPRKKGRY